MTLIAVSLIFLGLIAAARFASRDSFAGASLRHQPHDSSGTATPPSSGGAPDRRPGLRNHRATSLGRTNRARRQHFGHPDRPTSPAAPARVATPRSLTRRRASAPRTRTPATTSS